MESSETSEDGETEQSPDTASSSDSLSKLEKGIVSAFEARERQLELTKMVETIKQLAQKLKGLSARTEQAAKEGRPIELLTAELIQATEEKAHLINKLLESIWQDVLKAIRCRIQSPDVSNEEVEDLAQQTILTIYQRMEHFSGHSGGFRAWYLTVAINKCWAWRRGWLRSIERMFLIRDEMAHRDSDTAELERIHEAFRLAKEQLPEECKKRFEDLKAFRGRVTGHKVVAEKLNENLHIGKKRTYDCLDYFKIYYNKISARLEDEAKIIF